LGALGGVVASRVAREFKLGGPCFTLSAGNVSGIKAIESAVHSLSSNETDVFICGCVDLAGDIRQSILNETAKKTSREIIPSEGAAAIVLKRLDQAIEDEDKIYGVIAGTAGASGAMIPGETVTDPEKLASIYTQSLEKALKTSDISFSNIDLFETACTGLKEDDLTEIKILNPCGSKSNCSIRPALLETARSGSLKKINV